MDRRDPLVIRNQNQDVVNLVKKYCFLPNYSISYRDVFDGTEFGDKKRSIFLSFLFKDWVHEDISDVLKEADVIIHSGSIYDSIFASVNQVETVDVNINGLYNIVRQLNTLEEKRRLFVQLSSLNVYGDQSGKEEQENEITEDITVPNPKDLLNYTLYTQENMIKSLLVNSDYMILRLGTLCGWFTPPTSLVTSSVIALLDRKHHPEYTVYNPENSIELLDTNDLGTLISNIYTMYRDTTNQEKYKKAINQVYNIKAEESPEKTVRQIVEIIMSTPKRLPVITKEYGIKGISNFALKSPRITESLVADGSPIIRFGKPVSIAKSKELLSFLSAKPLVYSLLQGTVQYTLKYLLDTFKVSELLALQKMFYLPSLPSPETVEEVEGEHGRPVNKNVKKLVEDVNKGIEKAFDNEAPPAEAYEKAYEESGPPSSRPDL